MSSVQKLADRIAKELKIPDFKASRHFIYNFAERNNLKWKRRTTGKQQTIHSYLVVWDNWIGGLRNFSNSIGIVTPRGFIKSYHVWNADEFGLEPLPHNYKHLSSGGSMVNAQQLKMTINVTKRYCTVCGIVPKSGFPIECLVSIYLFHVFGLWFTIKQHNTTTSTFCSNYV